MCIRDSHNIASFRIECYKTENMVLKKVGLYTPDFLIIRRDNDNKIDKVLIIETKGKGYKEQSEFIEMCIRDRFYTR